MIQKLFSFIPITILISLLQNCSNSYPREKCEKYVGVFNSQAIFSFGNACFYPTSPNDPNNFTRCLGVAYLNYVCGNQPSVVYKMDTNLDFDGSERKARDRKAGQGASLMMLAWYNDGVNKGFRYYMGQNLTDSLKYLVSQYYLQKPLDGETKIVTCNKSGTAKMTFVKQELIVVMSECQHATNDRYYTSNITWSGDMQGILTYNLYSTEYFLNYVSMFGNLNYNGTITTSIYGSRPMNENCHVNIDYKFPNGNYVFCGNSSGW